MYLRSRFSSTSAGRSRVESGGVSPRQAHIRETTCDNIPPEMTPVFERKPARVEPCDFLFLACV